MDTVRINFELDKSIHKRAKEYALKEDETIKNLYTKWIIQGLERETGQKTLYDTKE